MIIAILQLETALEANVVGWLSTDQCLRVSGTCSILIPERELLIENNDAGIRDPVGSGMQPTLSEPHLNVHSISHPLRRIKLHDFILGGW